jgi:hypothetical protein
VPSCLRAPFQGAFAFRPVLQGGHPGRGQVPAVGPAVNDGPICKSPLEGGSGCRHTVTAPGAPWFPISPCPSLFPDLWERRYRPASDAASGPSAFHLVSHFLGEVNPHHRYNRYSPCNRRCCSDL